MIENFLSSPGLQVEHPQTQRVPDDEARLPEGGAALPEHRMDHPDFSQIRAEGHHAQQAVL